MDLNHAGRCHHGPARKFTSETAENVGITKAEADGRVYNLKKRGDFNGKYIAGAVEATIAVGAGEVLMRNDKGAVIHLIPKTQGVNLKLAGEGVKFTLEKK